MLILKIKEKGFYLDIPGATPARSPAEIDITRCNLSVVSTYLKKQGIYEYQIYTKSDAPKEKKTLESHQSLKSTPTTKETDKRFSKLEKIVGKLIEKEEGKPESKKEQIADKLETLEFLVRESLKQNKKEILVEKIKNKEPEIEELDDKFIPDIDITNMKMKGGSKEKVKQDKVDLDDNADLLSRIMGQED